MIIKKVFLQLTVTSGLKMSEKTTTLFVPSTTF